MSDNNLMERLHSTARILIHLYRLVKALEISEIDGIPDYMLVDLVIADCKAAMEKERLASIPGLSQTLEIADAGNAKLPKSDVTNLFAAEIKDTSGKLGDYEEKRHKLLETLRAFINEELKISSDQIIRMLVSNPMEVHGHEPIVNEHAKQEKKLQEFHVAIDTFKKAESILVDRIERLYATYCKLSGERALPLNRLLEGHAPQIK